MRGDVSMYALNRGVVDRRGLARMDIKRLAMAAEVQTNFPPRVLGSMMLRPGFGYIGALLAAPKILRHEFSTTDVSLLVCTPGAMTVWIQDVQLTRPAVSTSLLNGTFVSDLSHWTQYDEGSANSAWGAGQGMVLTGTGTSNAIREQAVTVSGANVGVEHALRIVVGHYNVTLRVGSASNGDDLVTETLLPEGTHSISFIPTGTFYVRFKADYTFPVWVSQCTLEGAGPVSLPTPWQAGDLANIRYDQSADVLFVACKGYQQRRIERRGTRPFARGWSVAKYFADDGPFNLENVTPTTITASAITGNVTLTASEPIWYANQVGSIFSLTSVGQEATRNIAAQNTFTNSIEVSGLTPQRAFTVTVSGTFSATVTVQRSFDNLTWADIGGAGGSFTAPGNAILNDSMDNVIVYYRIGVDSGNYVSGTAVCTISIPEGSIRGIARITAFSSSMSVSADVLTDLGGTAASSTWESPKWSDNAGWPTAVRFHEGRLWWSGQNGIWGSISDAFNSFDETYPGDAGPINRTVGSGPVDTVNFLLSLNALVVGAQGAEYTALPPSLTDPLTPTVFNLKSSSSQGSGNVDGIKIDLSGYFVNRTAAKIYDLSFDIRTYSYVSSCLMQLCPEIALAGIVRMDVQRQPDTRIHLVLADGTALIGVVDKLEDVLAWVPITTQGLILDVCVLPALPGNLDDQVYYAVQRTINGTNVFYLEKVAQELQCRGSDALCMLADSYVTYSGSPTTTIYCPTLASQQVVVWADGQDIGTDDSVTPWQQIYTVPVNGTLTLGAAYSNVVVGLPYTAQFQSAKLGLQTQDGSPLNRRKAGSKIGLVLADVHPKGLQFGPDFDTLDDMPGIEEGAPVGTGVRADYEEDMITFPKTWAADVRVCLQAQAPRPVTVMAVAMDLSQS